MEEVAINPKIDPPELTQDWGSRLLESVCPRTEKEGAVTPQETDPDVPGNVQESMAETWAAVAWCWVRGTERSSV